jgi:hypothetical protein
MPAIDIGAKFVVDGRSFFDFHWIQQSTAYAMVVDIEMILTTDSGRVIRPGYVVHYGQCWNLGVELSIL